MKANIFYLTLTVYAMTLFTGCKKDKPDEATAPDLKENTAIVLNEGGWGNNEAEISVIDLDSKTITNNYFSISNARGLGDVAQDAVAYGSKLYVAVWGSNTIEAIDRTSGTSTQIYLGNRGPRYIAYDRGKLYVSCYEPASVIRIDTATLNVEATCQLSGLRPEGLCIAAGKLFVLNSWKPDTQGNPLRDSTMSVVDLATFTEKSKITGGLNPQKIKQLDDYHVAISYSGDYEEVPGGLAIVNTNNMSIRRISTNTPNIDTYNGKIYYYVHTYGQAWNGTINILDGATMQVSSLTVSETEGFSAQYYPYAINVSPKNGNIYISGAQYGANGDIYCFSPSGTLEWKLEAGPLPSKILEL